MKRKRYYPLGQCGHYEVKELVRLRVCSLDYSKLRFERTGEFRTPKCGEWFLSGAKPEAYIAAHDFTTMPFHILKIAGLAEIVTTERIVPLNERETEG